MAPPETRYARNGDVRIAYQVIDEGEGALDLIVVPGLVSHLALTWGEPAHARFTRELAKFSRLILFDKRGTGLSDRDAGVASLEDRMDDVRAVLDAAGARRPAMLGISEGGMMSLLFAATYPERLSALALYGAFVHSATRAWPEDQVEARFDLVERAWGTGALPPRVAPSRAADQEFRRNWSRFERESATASAAAALLRIDRELDISGILPAVRVPTLLLHRRDDRRIGVENARYLAERIPGADYVELPGDDHLPYVGDSDRVIAEIEKFLANSTGGGAADRALRTIVSLAIDPRLAKIARAEIVKARGHELACTDGELLAAFDGPARATRCALAITEHARGLAVAAKAGMHTGEIALVGGAAGEICAVASRIAELAGPHEVMVSSAVRDLVAGSGLRFADRGSQTSRGLAEPLRLYAAG
jgi:pimeloyl-ACP methyl ester carboxylesterase